jgi:hypothetical protein
MERKDERIRKLELQLRGAYAGIGHAVRSSRAGAGLRDSIRSSSDDFSDVPETQNIFELHVTDANLYVSQAAGLLELCTVRLLTWPCTAFLEGASSARPRYRYPGTGREPCK